MSRKNYRALVPGSVKRVLGFLSGRKMSLLFFSFFFSLGLPYLVARVFCLVKALGSGTRVYEAGSGISE